ncbi:MAG: 4-hydroxythreonine-4-phosphate dehydrogenase PdxA [Candidatus Scalindua sp.]|nr:4-hydroxythreonine-4-phosphate dehydrogenase PdxA [Candidatus Scalindua sp.]
MKSENREKKLIGISMGDPGGIGPEVILKALASPEIRAAANYVVIGSEKVLSSISDRVLTDNVSVLDLDNFTVNNTMTHKPLAESGKASIEYITKGLDLAMNGKIDALVTAPICKEAIKLAGYDFAGHTELLKEKTSVGNVVMFMVGKGLRVSFVTTHLAVNEISGAINQENVFSTIQITATGLKTFFGIDQPKIAVCGLNPHCGDGDRFGTEERDIITPAIERAQEMGIDCHGPLSADTVFNKALNGEFDIVVVQFHDQGTIPIKMIAFDSGVNITLGIPVIRSSPTHGTAFDIAGKDIADPGSMIEAIKTAVKMAEARKHSFV